MITRAVLFDVDFTLIHPGRMFQGEGYAAFCARHGLAVDASSFDAAVRHAAPLLDEPEDALYSSRMFIDFTMRIIQGMGGSGPAVAACAQDIYDEWTSCQHFILYDDVPATFRALAARGIRIGLISNSHRPLEAFQRHFALDTLVDGAVSSSEHGYLKPHPSIFQAALRLLDAQPAESVMVGDNLRQDVEGARRVGMRGVLVRRPDVRFYDALPGEDLPDVPVIHSLAELLPLL